MSKKDKVMKYLILPLAFGLMSLILSFLTAHIMTYLILLIPHYSYTKEGSFSILLAMLLGVPIGIVFYFIFYFIKNMKNKIILLFLVIIFVFTGLALFDLTVGSCGSMNYKKKWDEKINIKESEYLIWSKVCRAVLPFIGESGE